MEVYIAYVCLITVVFLSIYSFVIRKEKIKDLTKLILSIAVTIFVFKVFKSDSRLLHLELFFIGFLTFHYFLSRISYFRTHLFSLLAIVISSLFLLLAGAKPLYFENISIVFNFSGLIFLPFIGALMWYLSDITAGFVSQFVGFESSKSIDQVMFLFFFGLIAMVASFFGGFFGFFLIGVGLISSSFYRKDKVSNIALAFLMLSVLFVFMHQFSIENIGLLKAKNIMGLCLGISGVWFLHILYKSRANPVVYTIIGYLFYLICLSVVILIATQKNEFGGIDAYLCLLLGTAIGLVSFNDFLLSSLVFSSSLLIGFTLLPYTIDTDFKLKKNQTEQLLSSKNLGLEKIIGNYEIDRETSELFFELGEKGTKTKGTITNFYGKVNIKKELSSSTFEVYIPVNNLSTNNDARDKELMSEDWLNSSKYPKMTYSSKNLVQTKDGYELKGTFNMLGVSQKVPVFIKLSSIDKESSSIGPILSGKSSINRMNHGMEQDGEGDVVDFVFKIQLKPITDSPEVK